MKLLILADDLTGALDSGVQLAKSGIKTIVTHDSSCNSLEKWPEVQVLVIDTETRHTSGESAYRKVYELASRAYRNGFELIYKKNDSTLRGNIGSELAGLMDAAGGSRLFFAPAYPRMNRTTVNGIQYVGGIPLEYTVYAKDPLNPVVKSSVTEIIAEQTDIPAVNVSIKDLSDIIENNSERKIIVIDAQDDHDLSEVRRLLFGKKRLLLAGSSGFSATLPDFIGKRSPEEKYFILPKRTLILSGSLNACSLNQICRATDQGIPTFVLSQEQLEEKYTYSDAGKRFRNQLSSLFESGNCAILQTSSDAVPADEHSCLEVAKSIGRLTGQIIHDVSPDLIIIFGGDTLLGVASSLNNSVILPQCEILTGVVQSYLAWDGGAIELVSKAGGFGEPDTLVNILRHYLGLDHREM